MPKLACGVATRRSHATASWVPAPRAAPSAAAIVTNGDSRRRSSTERSRAVNPASSTPLRSAPAQKCPPAPVSTTARTSSPNPSRAAPRASRVARSTALRRSGRSMVTTATWPRGSVWITGGTLPPAPSPPGCPADTREFPDVTGVGPTRTMQAQRPPRQRRGGPETRKHDDHTRARVAARPVRPPRVPVLGRRELDPGRVRRRAHGDRSRPGAPLPRRRPPPPTRRR